MLNKTFVFSLLCFLSTLISHHVYAKQKMFVTYVNNSKYDLFFDKKKQTAVDIDKKDPAPSCYSSGNFRLSRGGEGVVSYRITSNAQFSASTPNNGYVKYKVFKLSNIDPQNCNESVKKNGEYFSYEIKDPPNGKYTIRDSNQMKCTITEDDGNITHRTCTIN